MKILKQIVSLLILSVSLFAQQDIVTIETKKSTDAITLDGEFKFAVILNIQESWHINSYQPADEFSIPTVLSVKESSAYEITKIDYPEHELVELAISDEPSALYEGDIKIIVTGKVLDPTDDVLSIDGKISYQGCNNTTCLPPTDKSFTISYPIADEGISAINSDLFVTGETTATKEIVETDKEKGFDVENSFAQKGVILTYILIFFGGLGLILTPCVYPMIPITISYFGGQAGGKRGKSFLMAVFYVLGLAITNSTLGTLAALSGGLMGALLANPFVLMGIAAILTILALSMFGLFEITVPASLTNLGGGNNSGYIGALIMGLTLGIVAAPCVGPFIIGLLTYVATVGSPLIGFTMFFTLSLGMGLPFLFLGYFSSKIESLPNAGAWMVGVRKIFGFVLVAMALYFLKTLIPDSIYQWIFPGFILFSGIYLLLFEKSGDNTKVFAFIKKLIAIGAVFAAGWMLKPVDNSQLAHMEWSKYDETEYAAALQNQRPVILDFTAEWCAKCKELEKFTFSDQSVISYSEKFDLFKVDMTKNNSEKVEKLRQKFDIKGLPTVIFINGDGEEVKDLRITGFVESDKFLDIMQKTMNEN